MDAHGEKLLKLFEEIVQESRIEADRLFENKIKKIYLNMVVNKPNISTIKKSDL